MDAATYMRFCLDRLHQINADPTGNTAVNVPMPITVQPSVSLQHASSLFTGACSKL